jgi:hypothetical protein
MNANNIWYQFLGFRTPIATQNVSLGRFLASSNGADLSGTPYYLLELTNQQPTSYLSSNPNLTSIIAKIPNSTGNLSGFIYYQSPDLALASRLSSQSYVLRFKLTKANGTLLNLNGLNYHFQLILH